MVGLIEKIADRAAAMIPPIGERSPFLGREAFGNLEVEALHGGTGAVFGVRLLALRGQELLRVERLGGERLGRLLARRTYLSSDRTHTAALLAGQLPNLLAPVRRKGAGIAEQVGNDDAGPARGPTVAPDRTSHGAHDHEIDGKGGKQRHEQPAGCPPHDRGLRRAAGLRHSTSSSSRSTCATARGCTPRLMPVMSSSTGTTPWKRLETPRKTPSASEAASMPAALANPVGSQRGRVGRLASRTTLSATLGAAAVMLDAGTIRGERRAVAMMRSASAASAARDGSGARSRVLSSASASASSRRAALSRATSWPALARASTGQRVRSLPYTSSRCAKSVIVMPLLLMLSCSCSPSSHLQHASPPQISCLALRDQRAPFFLQRHLERAARPRQQRFHRLVRYAQHGAHLNLAHALVVEKGDRQTLPLGQRLQRRVHAGAKLALGEISHLSRRCALLRHLLHFLDIATGANTIDAQIRGYPPEPGAHTVGPELEPLRIAP